MNGLPKRSDMQLAYEARQLQEHLLAVPDHSKCSMAQPCKQVSVQKVETRTLRRGM